MNTSSPSTNPSQCPTTRQLRQWLDGELELEPAVVSHLQNCIRCAGSLAALSDDDELRLLAQRASADSLEIYSNEPEYMRLRTRLNEWSIEEANSVQATPTVDPPSTRRDPLQPTAVDASAHETLSLDELQRRLPAARFRVDRLLATGGAGTVYLAYDQRLQREVAIKVLSRDSLRDRQRFLREARLLAELEHPNIVRIFDFGTLASEFDVSSPESSTGMQQSAISTGPNANVAGGQLYLVMEYVAGGTVGTLRVEQPGGTNAESSNQNGAIDFQQLASLIATAADGLGAAHARSLVHRDVKPGNLLLASDGLCIKVADFGLARQTDASATQVTRTGDLVGTPDFMSPEQVTDGNLTPASDIYSLGATLYQLLTGVAPYRGGAAAVLRQIVESSPVSPRLIVSSIPTDLETICLHAMHSEPAGRYATMQQFADDLRAFASGQAIRARPISAAAKAMRFLRRNPSFTAMLLACVGLASLLMVGSIAAAIVFREQNVQLSAAVTSEAAAKRSAEDALKTSIQAAEELLLAVTTETEFLPRAPGSQEVTRKLLERARDYFRSFLDANTGNPTLTYQLARAHAGLGEVAMRVGDTATLERETEAALALIALLPDSEISAAERASLVADTLVVLANHLIESGEAKRAIPLLEEATTECRKVLETDASGQTEQAGKQTNTERELRASYASSTFAMANAFTWVGKRNEALPLLKEARDAFAQLRLDNPENPAYLRSAATCNMTMATIALDLDQAADSKPYLLSAMELLNQVQEDDAIALRIRELKVKALTNLALAERRMGNNVQAKANYEAVIAETRRLIELEPGVPSHQWNLVVAALNSGGPDLELGNLGPLVERWQATVPVLEKLIDNDPENRRYQQVKAMLQSNIAIVLRDMGKMAEAIEPLQAATETLRIQAEKLDYSPEAYLPVALNHYELASTFIQLERWPEAQQSLDASDAIVQQILEKDAVFTPARGHLLDSMHARLELLGKQSGSDLEVRRQLAQQSVELARQLASDQGDVTEFQAEVPRALNDYARTFLDAQQYPRALELAREARTLLEAMEAERMKLVDPGEAAPEVQRGLKNSLLIEARAMIGAEVKITEPAIKVAVGELLDRAAKSGAKESEIAAIKQLLEDKPQD